MLRRLLSIVSLVPVETQSLGNLDGHLPSTPAHLTENHGEQHQTDTTQPSATNDRSPCSPALLQRLFSLARSNDAAVRQGALCCLGKAVGYIIGRSLLSDQQSHAGTVQLLLERVSEAVRPWQPWQVRAAAARALQQSGQHPLVYGCPAPHRGTHCSSCWLVKPCWVQVLIAQASTRPSTFADGSKDHPSHLHVKQHLALHEAAPGTAMM